MSIITISQIRSSILGSFLFLTSMVRAQEFTPTTTMDSLIVNQVCSPAVSLMHSRLLLDSLPHYEVLVFAKEEATFFTQLKERKPNMQAVPSRHANDVWKVRIENNEDFVYLLNCPHIGFIDLVRKLPRTELIIKDYDRGLNSVTLTHSKYPQLRGSGIKASIKEDAFDIFDIDYSDRISSIHNDTFKITTHASTMATVVGGSGSTSYESLGIAPEIYLSSSGFFDLFPDGDRYFQDEDIGVQNHSYGIDIENFYGFEARAYDESSLRNSTVAHVFSAGNQGEETATMGDYSRVPGWSNITGNFKAAKNVITVGGVDSFGLVIPMSSKGPAYDGRIKPELVAMGARGSSEAAATVSGSVAILQQAFMEKNGVLPPSDLVKNILINSADDVGLPGIDFITGYGNLNLFQAVQIVESSQYISDNVALNDTMYYDMVVPENAGQLKVTLTWNDLPAQVNAKQALVNDLDLTVVASTGERYLPWVLSAFPHVDSLTSMAERKVDRLNTVEQISLDNPTPGVYTVSVSAHNLLGQVQEFNLSYATERADKFLWVNPAQGTILEAGKEFLIRWSHSFRASTGRMHYSLDGGDNWQLLDSLISLDHLYYKWKVPQIFSKVLLRMQIDEEVFISDTFIISPKTEIDVAYDCADELLLRWDSVTDATFYNLYKIGPGSARLVSSTDQLFYYLKKTPEIDNYFAVAPVNQQIEGFRSLAIDLQKQRASCYIISFSAESENAGARLNLLISDIAGVKKVRIEKEFSGTYLPIHEFQEIDRVQYTFLDQDLAQGLHLY
ncbi:MAG: S8 family serine peptidase, partial [Saprospiraceae bacterium]|nr:S8 family serine peptidase [Saprospiraceae bacterium]